MEFEPSHERTETMITDRRCARQAGLLYLLAIATGVLGLGLTGLVDGAGFPSIAAGYEIRLVLGAILMMIMALSCSGIAIGLYPVLRRYHGRLALGAVLFRSVEAVMFLIAAGTLFSLVSSRGAGAMMEPNAAAPTIVAGSTLAVVRAATAYILGPWAFTAGTILYSVIFFRHRLLPRWLSVWGITAAVVHAVGALLVALTVITPWSTAHLILNALSLQEIVLALWLTIKGLNTVTRGLRA